MSEHALNLPVAVDTAGSDHGPETLVEGALAAFHEFQTPSILVGIEDDLRSILQSLGAPANLFPIVHAPQVVGASESPTRAVRRKTDSSIVKCFSLIESGEASAVVSAGQSGATMAAGKLLCGLLTGIERPAIATLLPVAGDNTPNVILDCGANVDSHAHHLVQFAVMGSVYFSTLFNEPRPRVGLLSNGTEPGKGTDTLRTAFALLTATSLVNFVGYIEGRDIPRDRANVIVCDGFVGNVVLKALEGCVKLIADELQHEAENGFVQRLGHSLARDTYQRVFFEKFDYSAHGGAPLLGLRRVALVLHGASDARAVKNGIRTAQRFAAQGLCDKLGDELAHLEELMLDTEETETLTSIGLRRSFERKSKVGWPLGRTRKPKPSE